MQIKIKTLTGRVLQLNFEPEETIAKVKEALQEKEGIESSQIKLIFSGKQLVDEATLAASGVTAGTTMHMILALRG